MRADYMLEQSKQYGYRIIGALFWEYNADAIVIPDFHVHKRYMKLRPDLDLEKIKEIRNIYFDHSVKYGIPVFDTIEEAVTHIDKIELLSSTV